MRRDTYIKEEEIFKAVPRKEVMARKTAFQKANTARRQKDTWQDRILGMEPEEIDPVLTMWFDEPPEEGEDERQIFLDFADSLMREYQIDLSDLVDTYVKTDQVHEVKFCAEAAERIAKAGFYVYDSDTRFEVYEPEQMYEVPYESVNEADDIFQPAPQEEIRKRRAEVEKQRKARNKKLRAGAKEHNEAMLDGAESWIAIAFKELQKMLDVAVLIEDIEDTYVTMRVVGEREEANNGEREWMVFQNSDLAEQVALERVRDDLEHEPEVFNSDWLSNYITISDTDRRIMASEEADNLVDEVFDDHEILSKAGVEDEYAELQDQLDNLDPEDEGYDDQTAELEQQMEQMLEDAKETVRDQESDRIEDELQDPVRYFVHDHGLYSLEDLVHASFIMIDYDEAAEAAISEDGVAHFLDRYDGAEVELPSGAVAYGTN